MPSPTFQQSQTPEQIPELSDFGNQYLENIPDEDKAIVEKYVKEWDGNVTRKFQEYAENQKKYEELGDITALTNATQVMLDIQANPVEFYEYMRDYLLENEQFVRENYGVEDLATRLGVNMEQENSTGLPEHEGMNDDQVVNQQLTEKISMLEEKLNGFENSTREQEQMKMLDATLEKMHTEHGDFDETFVLSQIAGGKSPEDAISAYNNLKQSIIDSHSENPPDLLTGPSGTPLDQVDMTKLKNPSERKELGAKLLERSLRS